MATIRTVTVKSTGGDYSSLSAAEAGEQGDLVSLDRQLNIECYAMSDTTQVVIDGSTTDATRFINIYAPSSDRHAGVWNTSKYRHQISASFTNSITISDDFVRLVGLQIDQSTHASTDRAMGIFITSTGSAAASDIQIVDCIIQSCGRNSSTGGIFGGSGKVTVINCVVYDCSTGVRCTFNTSACALNGYNITSVGNSINGYHRDGGTMALTNCYAGGNTTADYSGTITRTTCAHSSATVFTGSTASVAYSTANFTNVTAGSVDLHLPSGSALIDVGTDVSGTTGISTDIDGVARSGTWDIGADEFVADGGGDEAKPWLYRPFTVTLGAGFLRGAL